MDIQSVENFLDKFDYSYERVGDILFIKMDFYHDVIIDFSNPKKILIKDQLKPCNFLTGCFRMSLKQAILFNIIFTVVASLLVGFVDVYVGLILFFGLMLWGLLWSILYISKYENLRYILINRLNRAV
ncbi:hypothetical protein KFZ70_05670 [Tamlana fucoidanivorans]|uniref:Uncharacterized protein n=1 Tax=Allotamlana fucoidanivorans TaxID=2583814 RepID=A0A5C4SRF3_9FLAO|nr:hypothetical protein [Tamlana fucoidanivorans]TNJ47004.1 hypothetical protein FGF67_00310 [Tamlana fucoidanivorans]